MNFKEIRIIIKRIGEWLMNDYTDEIMDLLHSIYDPRKWETFEGGEEII